MKERTYCTGEYTGFKHRTYECRVRALCKKYEAFKDYLDTHNSQYPNFDDTYSKFHECERVVSDRAEAVARNSFTWLGPTSM